MPIAAALAFPTSKNGVWMELYKYLDPDGYRHEVLDMLMEQGGPFARAHGIEHMGMNLRRAHSSTQAKGGWHFSNDGWQPLHKVVMLCKLDSQLQPVESWPMEPVLNESHVFLLRAHA